MIGYWLHRSRWMWPALLLGFLALVFRGSLWEPPGPGTLNAVRHIPGYFLSIGFGLLGALYGILCTDWSQHLLPVRRGLHPSSQAEVGCVLVLLRGGVLSLLYVWVYLAWTLG